MLERWVDDSIFYAAVAALLALESNLSTGCISGIIYYKKQVLEKKKQNNVRMDMHFYTYNLDFWPYIHFNTLISEQYYSNTIYVSTRTINRSIIHGIL